MKFGKDSNYWPKDSLKRSLLLNYPGCKSVLDAFHLTKQSGNTTSLKLPSINEDYVLMRDVIIELTSKIDFDIDELDVKTKESLANISDPVLWRDSWLDVLRSRGKRGEDFTE